MPREVLNTAEALNREAVNRRSNRDGVRRDGGGRCLLDLHRSLTVENGLAKIVGTRTGGQVLGGGNFSVGHGFVLRFPAAGWYTRRGAIVEGKGVEPDVDIPLSSEGLRQGKDNQLEAAIAMVEIMQPGVESRTG
jgi:hypothetical protein